MNLLAVQLKGLGETSLNAWGVIWAQSSASRSLTRLTWVLNYDDDTMPTSGTRQMIEPKSPRQSCSIPSTIGKIHWLAVSHLTRVKAKIQLHWELRCHSLAMATYFTVRLRIEKSQLFGFSFTKLTLLNPFTLSFPYSLISYTLILGFTSSFILAKSSLQSCRNPYLVLSLP